MKSEGRTTKMLRAMLEALGFEIGTFFYAQGGERRQDVFRWGATGQRVSLGRFNVTIDGWDTMTACIAKGFVVQRDRRNGWAYEVHANSTKGPCTLVDEVWYD